MAAIWLWGEKADQRLALWALLANVLPFFLVSLTRYQRSVSQAFVARYDIFTLIGALLLVGIAWRLLAARMPSRRWATALGGVILAVMVCGQLFSLPIWTAKYLEMSRLARKCYVVLNHGTSASQSITRGGIPASFVLMPIPASRPARPGPYDACWAGSRGSHEFFQVRRLSRPGRWGDGIGKRRGTVSGTRLLGLNFKAVAAV